MLWWGIVCYGGVLVCYGGGLVVCVVGRCTVVCYGGGLYV